MSFQLAEAFVQFGVQGVGSVDSAVARVKSQLSGMAKGSASFDLSKGLKTGVTESFKSLKGNVGNLGTLFGEAMSSIKGGSGITSTLTSAFSLAGPEIAAVLSNPITGVVAGAVLAGVGLAVASIPIAIEREFKMTRLGIQTGNQDRAEQLHGGLKKAFTGTGIDESEFTAPVAAMAQKGATPEKITAQMKILGNISIATGESMGGMAEALERAQASGKITGRTLQAMRPVAEELARTYGVSTEQIFAMGEGGAIRVRDLQAAMERLGGATGIWGNALTKMQNTTSGAWSQLSATTKGFLGDIGTYLMKAFNIQGVLQTWNAFMEYWRALRNLIEEILPVADIFQFMFEAMLKPLRLIVQSVTEMINKLREAIHLMKRFANPFSQGDKRVGPEEPIKGGTTRGQFEFSGLTAFAEKMQGEAGAQYTLPQQQLDAQKEGNKSLAEQAIAIASLAACSTGTALRIIGSTTGKW